MQAFHFVILTHILQENTVFSYYLKGILMSEKIVTDTYTDSYTPNRNPLRPGDRLVKVTCLRSHNNASGNPKMGCHEGKMNPAELLLSKGGIVL